MKQLPCKQAQIWLVDLQEMQPSVYLQYLSAAEKNRANRFVAELHRDRFIVSHGVLRCLLAERLAVEPHTLEFKNNKYGKPFLESNKLHFNLSHSQDLALYAFSCNGPVGVDIEFCREQVNWEELARRFFSECEQEQIFSLPATERKLAFFRCWSRKEAFIKAIGQGLSFPLHDFDVAVTQQEKSLLLAVRNAEYSHNDWHLADLQVNAGYSAACAYGVRS